MSTLSMWVVYDHPLDYSTMFVARRHEVGGAGHQVTGDVLVSGELGVLRAQLRRNGLVRLPRDPEDDRTIMETWL